MGRYSYQFSILKQPLISYKNPFTGFCFDFSISAHQKKSGWKPHGFYYFTLVLLLFSSFFASCTSLPEADFYEVNGIVSVNARSLPPQNNWNIEPYHTSVSMVSSDKAEPAAGLLTFPFYIRQPGYYTIWTLTKQGSSNPDENFLPLRVMDGDFLIGRYRLQLGASNALQWLEKEFDNGENITVFFDTPGHYSIAYESGGHGGFVVDKLHLTLNNEYPPEGFGFPETADPNLDPFFAVRDQPVIVPPAWAFGVLYGGYTNQQQTMKRVERLLEENYAIDGYWINDYEMDEHSAEYSDLSAMFTFLNRKNIKTGVTAGKPAMQTENERDAFASHGIDFLKLPGTTSINFLRTAFETTQIAGMQPNSRGFVLNGLSHIFDSAFMLYPANLLENSVSSWSQPIRPDAEHGTMGGLKENIEMAANPRFTTYEAPFLSVNSGGYHLSETGQISEELYIRWVQFAAFNTMMHVFAAPENETSNLPYHFSGEAQQQFKNLTQLRNTLFPYIYSHAHLLRSTREKPVRGDGRNTTQFQLGDAFLIAPVYEEGAEERLVYLPDGTWYDYWDGTRHNGGSSWYIEAPLTKIPVFVKAGSIIPYRDYSQSIMAGSNDRLTIEIYSGGASSFRLYEDDGISTNYQQGQLATTAFRYFEHPDGYSTFTIGRMVRSYEGQPPEKEFILKLKFVDRPAGVSANQTELETGEGASQWLYDEDSETLTINWIQPNDEKTDFVIRFSD